jgi:hypothetical protein
VYIDLLQITTSLLNNNFSTLKISKGKKYDVGMSIGIDVNKDIREKSRIQGVKPRIVLSHWFSPLQAP